MKSDDLREYQTKRNFEKTSEPSPTVTEPSAKPIFVIQKHDASRLHYDLRLEIDGVLKSWAVPKGPSTDHRVKRLAIPTEDHPMAYAVFEGVIPEDEYGGGTVMVWDTGTYRNIQADKAPALSMSQALDKGRVEIFLEGWKLKGRFALIQTGRGWLFFKMKDEYADEDDILETAPDSALSGKSLTEIKEQSG
ncbi:DNA ligase D, 3'-phosphoesterase domain protein [Dehalogenimonas lykanthroporepellens BL-DC-9]|jgi:DNA ligase D-like protein (predicted 3'-phosphoesterase)|nr:DNA ligase D, 3'-phosphoesterase domain protein [Dehalogenimonas lykanthroporepellens BL-DC-9]